MFVFKFAFKNIVSRKSSFVIILFIAFALSLLFVSNAIFDGTDSGLRTTYSESFTGDIVIRPVSEFPLSLFGDETPVTGELSAIPELIPFSDVLQCVSSIKDISSVIPQLSGMVALSINGHKTGISLFGVEANKYTQTMTGIEIIEGEPFEKDEHGIMLNEELYAKLKEKDKNLSLKDKVQLITANSTTFTIRAVPVTAIYRYKVQNSTLNNIALIDPQTLRDLMNLQDFSEAREDIDNSQADLLDDFSMEDLFSDSTDSEGEEAESDAAFIIEENSIGEEERDASKENLQDSTVWNYIICSLKNGSTKNTSKIIRELNAQFEKNDWPVQAITWRAAAGGAVSLTYYLRSIFNIGIILILLTGFIVVNNTLTISALGRVGETGTLRAMGASRSFVAAQFFLETAILTVSSGILSVFLGAAVSLLLQGAHIELNNEYLSQLFGGTVLTATITFKNILRTSIVTAILALIGWLYPVKVALSSNPVEAMRSIN